MKSTVAYLFLLLLLACSDDHGNEKQATRTLPKRDSAVAKPSPVNPYSDVDLSPMDVSYFPADYPILKMTNKIATPPIARVIYSRPQKQGRQIFGSLIKYGEPWRLGANEATEIEIFQTVSIQNKKIPKGRYILYSIPQEKTWTIIFNSNIYSWGLRTDPKKDLYQFESPVQQSDAVMEFFTMVFEKTGTGADLIIGWDDKLTRLPFAF